MTTKIKEITVIICNLCNFSISRVENKPPKGWYCDDKNDIHVCSGCVNKVMTNHTDNLFL